MVDGILSALTLFVGGLIWGFIWALMLGNTQMPSLLTFTPVLGYLIWALIVYGRGQTPGKQLLGMRYVNLKSGEPAGWGRTFMREWIAKSVVGLFAWMTLGLVYFWLMWDRDNQELWDKIVGTIVVDDQSRQLG